MYFISSRRLRQGFDSLINIKQGEQESLRSYVSRFHTVTLEIYNLDHAIAIIVMKSGLQRCPNYVIEYEALIAGLSLSGYPGS